MPTWITALKASWRWWAIPFVVVALLTIVIGRGCEDDEPPIPLRYDIPQAP